MPSKKSNATTDELREEYDFSKLSGGVRGKYFERASTSSNVVVLDADVAKAFPTQDAVNEALRMLAEVATATVGSREQE